MAAYKKCAMKIKKELNEEVNSKDKLTLKKIREWLIVGNITFKKKKFAPCMYAEFPVPHKRIMFRKELIPCFVTKCDQTRFWAKKKGKKRQSTARELAWLDLCLLDCVYDKVMSKCSNSTNKSTRWCSYAGWDEYVDKDETNTSDVKTNKVDARASGKERTGKGESMSAKKGKVASSKGNEEGSFYEGSVNGNDLSWFQTVNL